MDSGRMLSQQGRPALISHCDKTYPHTRLSHLVAPRSALHNVQSWLGGDNDQLSSRLGPAQLQSPCQRCSHNRVRTAATSTTKSAAAAAPPAASSTSQDASYRMISKLNSVVTAQVKHGPSQVVVDISVELSGGHAFDAPPPELHWGLYRVSFAKWHQPKEVVPEGSAMDANKFAMISPLTWNQMAKRWVLQLKVPAKLLPLHLGMWLHRPGTRERQEGPASRSSPLRHFSVPLGMSAGLPAPQGASLALIADEQNAGASRSVNFVLFSRHSGSASLCLVRVSPDEATLVNGKVSLKSVISSGSGSSSGSSTGSRSTASKPSSSSSSSGVLDLQDLSTIGSSGSSGGGSSSSRALKGIGALEVVLDPRIHRTGDMWHIRLDGLKDLESLCYGWRLDGHKRWENQGRFHPGFLQLDPWARLAVPVLVPDAVTKAAPRLPPGHDPSVPVPLASLGPLVTGFDWQEARAVKRALDGAVLAEVDVRTFTSTAAVQRARRGKLLGILDRMDLLIASGISTVVLTPLSLPDASGRLVSFMSPDPQLSSLSLLEVGQELKAVVKGLHQAGIQVLLQLEFCITSASGEGAWQGLQGVDADVYYRGGGSGSKQLAVLNTGQPAVQKLVVDSLRHWAQEYQLDGFVLLNAENLAQDTFGRVLDSPPLVETLAHDPVLRGVHLVSNVSDPALLPRSGARGFPHCGVWLTWNDRFTRTAWTYLAENAHGILGEVATRIAGSPDLLKQDFASGMPAALGTGRKPACGINSPIRIGDVALGQAIDPDGMDQQRSEVLAGTLLLLAFVSAGVPSVSSSSLVERPHLSRLVEALGGLRLKHAALLAPVQFTSPRDFRWHSASNPGEAPDWGGVGSDVPVNVLAFSVRSSVSGTALYVAFNPYPHEVAIRVAPAPEGCQWRPVVDTARLPFEDALSYTGPLLGLGPSEYPEEYWLRPYGGLLLEAEVPVKPKPAYSSWR